ncbi:hypothetical protein NEOLI_004453 [Neolecta irregularis DAH-3]|uniref:Uncharacterized protein n=1 Tax=Neolecta irregularis (strain DAH-3) TaxID=1198029 RepID=A0A1U7LKH9_NEOID|nr:hypothetical protein NEOLI_004453 [Neolecta irregularis DAH-3]|eukprot:OLL23166.1 hypothetical protein NEOLI_004453 [Neolecta irregularis DAH-3]
MYISLALLLPIAFAQSPAAPLSAVAISQQQLNDCQCDGFFQAAGVCQLGCTCGYLFSTIGPIEGCIACLGNNGPTDPFVVAVSQSTLLSLATFSPLALSSIYGNCGNQVNPIGNQTAVCSDFSGLSGCIRINDGSAFAESVESGTTVSGSIQCTDCHATATGSILTLATVDSFPTSLLAFLSGITLPTDLALATGLNFPTDLSVITDIGIGTGTVQPTATGTAIVAIGTAIVATGNSTTKAPGSSTATSKTTAKSSAVKSAGNLTAIIPVATSSVVKVTTTAPVAKKTNTAVGLQVSSGFLLSILAFLV